MRYNIPAATATNVTVIFSKQNLFLILFPVVNGCRCLSHQLLARQVCIAARFEEQFFEWHSAEGKKNVNTARTINRRTGFMNSIPFE